MIKNHELTVPRKEALATGLLFDISHPARVYGDCLIPVALTQSLWRALALGAEFDDRDERVVRLCSLLTLVSRGQVPSSTVNVPGLQVALLGYTLHGRKCEVRAMRHLTEEGEPVCTLCAADTRDLERCADVLFRCHGLDLTIKMYRVLGLPVPDVDLARLGGSELWRLPIDPVPGAKLSSMGQETFHLDGNLIGQGAADSDAVICAGNPEVNLPI